MVAEANKFERFYGMFFWETDGDGISGALKEQYSDFIVEEIQPDGKILSLDNLEITPSGYEGLFTHFILIKEGIGNYEAVWILAKKLGVPTSWFSYFGNKDRDAVTIQRMAVWGVSPNKLLEIKLPKYMKISSPIRELRRLNMGQHKGNNFKITIRKIDDGDLITAYNFLKEAKEGFLLPNFFGYQRFGVTKPVSAIIGKLLINKCYQKALEIYLTFPSIYDDEQMMKAKKYISEGAYKEALELYPRRGFLFERLVLKNMLKIKDTKRLLKKLPKFHLRMFVEAYQSYIFNKTLSTYRIEGGPYKEQDRIIRIPIIGHDVQIKKGKIGRILLGIMKEENIDQTMFRNKDIPSLHLTGLTRVAALLFKPTNIEKDSKNSILKFEFKLGKGQFATIVMRELFKENILHALYSKLVEKMGKENFERKMHNIIEKGYKMLRTPIECD